MTAGQIHKAELEEIMPLRALYLQETNCQIRYNARHERGWTDSYLIKQGDNTIGYGALMGQEIPDRDTIFEYYLIPAFRNKAKELFRLLIEASRASFIEGQSNDTILSPMIYAFSRSIRSDVILFGDHVATSHVFPDATIRHRLGVDHVFEHKVEPGREYVVLLAGEVVAKGGFLLHYNFPFADIYMEVKEGFRGMGVGCFVVQEAKKACYLAGRVPAARCDTSNIASRATLIRAGLKVCGHMLLGTI
jgi:hypothetical protein